jgi:signal transduction histidine kinase/ActR/RegA family two-component response regulator
MSFLKGLQKGIVTKLIFLNTLILLLVVGILVENLFLSKKLGKTIITVVDKDLSQAIDNAALSREINHIFTDIRYTASIFTVNKDLLNEMENRLIPMLRDMAGASNIKKLQKVLDELTKNTVFFIDQCKEINASIERRKLLEHKLDENINKLEDAVTKIIVTRKLEGKGYELSSFEQIIHSIPDFRTSFLKVAMLLKNAEQAGFLKRKDQVDYERQIFIILSDFQSNLTSSITAGEELSAVTSDLMLNVKTYKVEIISFHAAMRKFKEHLELLENVESQVMAVLGEVEKEIAETTVRIRESVTENLQSTKNLNLILCIAVIVLLTAIGTYGVVIAKSIQSLTNSASEIAAGDLERPITAGGKDEIAILGRSLMRMRDAIKEKIVDLSQKNEALILEINKHKQTQREREQLKVQLIHAQRMEAIGTLAGGIAHDFNNILSAIMGYTELAILDLPETSEANANLQQILNAANRAKDVVKQILAFSRQSKQIDKPLKIGPIIKECLKLLRASIPTTIEIHQNVARESGAVVIDLTQIHQVIMNLCTNAAHAMQETGGVLDVNLIEMDLGLEDKFMIKGLSPGKYVRITVSDTGHGIPPGLKERIFDPYFTTKGLGVGTGLGLSVAHGIVKNHGGAFSVYSESGKGSTFHVYLPRIDADVIDVSVDKKSPPVGNEQILFIDDEETLVQIGRQMLERLGYKVSTRSCSVEALEDFREDPMKFDLVITDQTMPNMTGEMLAKEMMQIRSDIPIILCTGFSHLVDQKKSQLIGIRAFLMKPLILKDLAVTIRKVLDPIGSKES